MERSPGSPANPSVAPAWPALDRSRQNVAHPLTCSPAAAVAAERGAGCLAPSGQGAEQGKRGQNRGQSPRSQSRKPQIAAVYRAVRHRLSRPPTSAGPLRQAAGRRRVLRVRWPVCAAQPPWRAATGPSANDDSLILVLSEKWKNSLICDPGIGFCTARPLGGVCV